MIAIRDHLVLSQRELATEVGVTQSIISNYELGKTTPPPHIRNRIVQCLSNRMQINTYSSSN